jgi:molecular chaperone DnaJ
MASRNHYVILGVASTESDRGIRSAFRTLAKRYHPDRVGSAGAAAFREVIEAYQVLHDPSRRREYDNSLNQPRRADLRVSAEPLVRHVSMRGDLADARPSRDAIFDRIARNFTGRNVAKAERLEELNLDVAISAEQAGTGTCVQLGIPVFRTCSSCQGRGCGACLGRGATEAERALAVDVPPMSGSGATFVMPLSRLGIHNFYLRLRVRVDPSR